MLAEDAQMSAFGRIEDFRGVEPGSASKMLTSSQSSREGARKAAADPAWWLARHQEALRDAVKLMAQLILLPIADQIESGTYLLYDGACGTGGMLTVAEETLRELAEAHGKQVATHLYGQEVKRRDLRHSEGGFSPQRRGRRG
jgi:N-6 DNA Methylase